MYYLLGFLIGIPICMVWYILDPWPRICPSCRSYGKPGECGCKRVKFVSGQTKHGFDLYDYRWQKKDYWD